MPHYLAHDILSKSADIWGSSPGCTDIEMILPVLLTEGYHARGLSFERIVERTSFNAERLMGLEHAKGRMAPRMNAERVKYETTAPCVLSNA